MLGAGGPDAHALAVIGLATAGAIYAYNGYGGAVYFGEEMYEARTKVAWVVFSSLIVAVAAEFVPIAAALAGAADLTAMLGARQAVAGLPAGCGRRGARQGGQPRASPSPSSTP